MWLCSAQLFPYLFLALNVFSPYVLLTHNCGSPGPGSQFFGFTIVFLRDHDKGSSGSWSQRYWALINSAKLLGSYVLTHQVLLLLKTCLNFIDHVSDHHSSFWGRAFRIYLYLRENSYLRQIYLVCSNLQSWQKPTQVSNFIQIIWMCLAYMSLHHVLDIKTGVPFCMILIKSIRPKICNSKLLKTWFPQF